MTILKSEAAKLIAFCAIGVTLSGCMINDALNRYIGANKRSLVPFAVEFHPASQIDAAKITNTGTSLQANLNDVLIDWKVETCAKINCNSQNNLGIINMVEGMPIARPDLNRDGKEDLVISILQYSGLGNCGAAEYRFYENAGDDFRPIGKAKVTRIQSLYEIDDAHKGEFKTLLWRAELDCENKPINSEQRHVYDKANQRYYEID